MQSLRWQASKPSEKSLLSAYGTDKRPLVEEWLRRKEENRVALTSERAEDRDVARLNLAQDANQIARGSAKTARAAYCISVLSVIVALVATLIAALAYLAKA
jgi:hypothetical protein